MYAKFLPSILVFLIAAGGTIFGVTARAAHLDQHKVVDGIEVFYGMVPVEIIRGYPKESAERQMHGGVPRSAAQHHLMVSLFDAKTKQPIADAEVKAKVTEIGLGAQEKKLERMTLAGTISYGNYFRMTAPGRYQIAVKIRRSASQRATEVKFEYSHLR